MIENQNPVNYSAMKRLLYSIAVILCFYSVMAQKSHEISFDIPEGDVINLTFDLNEHTILSVMHDGIMYSEIVSGSVVTNKKGYAKLPYFGASVRLLTNKNVDLIVIGYEYKDIDLEYPLLPSRGVIYRDQDPSVIPYKIDPASVTDNWYPSQVVSCTDPFIIRDIRGAGVYFYPFRYNAANNILRIITSISVELVENESPPVNPLNRKCNKINAEMDAVYRSAFINYDMTREDLEMGDHGDILVITVSEYEQAIAPYIQWKREKGYDVFLELVSPGTNVKDVVQEEFNENNNILYVLLVGDWGDIQSDLGTSSNLPMDPQLGCVMGSDYYADICIGRFSASTAQHVITQVNKTIHYERDPDMDGIWYSSALGIGSSEGAGIGDDGEIDKEHLDTIYYNKLEPFTFDTYYTAHDPGGSISGVSAAVNAGVSLINYTGHGGPTGWGTTGFSNSNVNNLTNGNKLPVVISVACSNGQFNDTECFAEAWLKKEDGGAIIALMSTIGQPWDPPMRGQDYMMDILTGGYDYEEHPDQDGISTNEQRTVIGSIIFNSFVLMLMESDNTSDLETVQTWTTFGDPALQMRTETPADIQLSNETAMVGIPFETVVSAGQESFEGAMVCISQDNNYYSEITDEAGNVSISHALNPGPALLVVTGFNLGTVYQMIEVASADGPWIIYSGHSLNDETGNNNSLADYSEDISIDIAIKNVGVQTADNITASISSSNQYITITDNEQDFGDITVGGVADVTSAYSFTVADILPDQEIVIFILDITDGTDNWQGQFTVVLNAPDPDIVFNYIDDNAGGNGNNILDPGETADIYISAMNEGHAATGDSEISLSTSSGYLTINTVNVNTGILDAGSDTPASFSITVDNGIQAGTYVDLIFSLSAGDYSIVETINLPVGLIIEDWETGDFNSYEWEQDGNTPWIITDTGPYEGAYCAQSGDIDDDESSVLEIIMDVLINDTLKFYKKVSSEDNYDFLIFEIDENEMGSWAGEVEWSIESYPVEAGEHRFTWKYEKDYSVSTGSDCAWIDYIRLPAHESSQDIYDLSDENKDIRFSVYPNPGNGLGTIYFYVPESALIKLSLIDMIGEEVEIIIDNNDMSNGEYYMNFDYRHLGSGIYYCRLAADNNIFYRKLIITR